MAVTAGSDIYGAVRRVDGTPIVTKFAMLQFVPLFPLESYYLRRVAKKSGVSVPLLGGYSSQAIAGLRLAKLDRLSVLVAYLRGIGAVLAVVSCIGLFGMLVTSFSGTPMNAEQRMIAAACAVILGVGLLISVPTYYFTFVVAQRDMEIRRACAKWLGLAADPAQIVADEAKLMLTVIDETLAQRDIHDPVATVKLPHGLPPDLASLLLVRSRAQVAIDGGSGTAEGEADQLLLAISRAILTS